MSENDLAKRILVISPTPSHPQNAGNRVRIFHLVQHLRNLGHDVFFILIEMEKDADLDGMRSYYEGRFLTVPFDPPYPSFFWRLRHLLGLNPEHSADHWYPLSLDKAVRQLADEIVFDIVLVEYIFFSRCLNLIDQNTRKIIDTIDVFSNRHKDLARSGTERSWFSTARRQEAKALNRADVVVAITERDRIFFRKLTNRRVVTIGHLLPVPHDRPRERDGALILFVGSGNPHNVQALRFFVDEILPLVHARVPEAELCVAGSVCQQFLDDHSFTKLGFVDDLTQLYARASLVVNPMLTGTGLAIKTLEALAHGLPVVATTVGARGLDEAAGAALLVLDAPQPFAQAIVDLLQDSDRAQALSANARDFVREYTQRDLQSLTELVGTGSDTSPCPSCIPARAY